MTSKNICIIGPGALGLFLACSLSAEHNVYLLVKESHLKFIADNTLEISGALKMRIPPNRISIITANDLGQLPRDCSFWLCVKAYDIDQSVLLIKDYLSSSTPLVILSNGLGILFQVAINLGRNVPHIRILSNFGVLLESPTKVVLSGEVNFSLSSLKEHTSHAETIKAILQSLTNKICIEKDVATAEWKKSLINLVVNPICTIANRENGAVLTDPHLKNLASEVLGEIREVSSADGFDFSELTDDAFFESIKHHSSNINSCLIDLRRGKKTEIDFILGRFLRIADDHGIPVPRSSALFSIFKALETPS